MRIDEIVEGVAMVYGKKGNKVTKKYRCTSGSRKGRIVAKPSTCSATKKVGSSLNIKRAKARRSSVMKVKTARTKRAGGLTKRLTKANKPLTQRRYKKSHLKKNFRSGKRTKK